MAGREAKREERQDKANGEAESNREEEEEEEEGDFSSQSSERFNSFDERRDELGFELNMDCSSGYAALEIFDRSSLRDGETPLQSSTETPSIHAAHVASFLH